MSAQVTSLSLAVDSSSVKTAATDLNQMATAGRDSAQAATVLQTAISKVNASTGTYGRNLTTGVQATQFATDAITKHTTAAATMGRTLQLTAHQQQQLGFQLNDFAVQVASGQSPLTALIQQGSQLSGTFGGVRGALSALGTVFTGTRLAIGGVVSAVGAFAMVALQSHEQTVALNRALHDTGNAAGVTAGQFARMQAQVAASARVATVDARETLQALVESGRLSGDALTTTAIAVQQLARASGESTEDIVKQVLALSNGVGKGAEELNRQYHFLTASQLEQIQTLEQQGSAQKALEATMGALSVRLGQSGREVDDLSNRWSRLKRSVSDAMEASRAALRDATPEERLATVEAELARRERPGPLRDMQAYQGSLDRLRAQRAELQQLIVLDNQKAAAQAQQAALEQAQIQFGKLKEQSLSKQAKLTEELKNANALADKAQASAEDRQTVLTGIRERYGQTGPDPNALRKAQLEADLAQIQRLLAERNNAYRNADAVFNAQRQAGLVSDRDAYAERRRQLQQSEDAEVGALTAQTQRLQAQKLQGKEAAKDEIERGQKIADHLAEIARVRADTAAQRQVIDIEEGAALRQRAADYLQGRIAAQQYFDAVQRSNALELSQIASSNASRSNAQGRAQIEERAQSQRNELSATRQLLELQSRFGADDQQRYDQRLAVLNDYQRQALAQWDEHYAALQQQEGDWVNGASRAMGNYVDAAKNVAQQSEELFNNAFQSIGDRLATLVTTGKFDFKGLANSIIADLARMQARAAMLDSMKSGGLLSGLFGLFTSSQAGGIGNAGAGDYKAYYDGLQGAGGLASLGSAAPGMVAMSLAPMQKTLSVPASMPRAATSGTTALAAGSSTTHNYNVQAGVSRNELTATLQTFAKAMDTRLNNRLRSAGV